MPDPEPLSPASQPAPRRRNDAASASDSIRIVLAYHQQTKHHLDRYARSLGYLDWATQPNPFRTYARTRRVDLPLAADNLHTLFADLFTPAAIPAQPLNLTSVGILFELALGLSAWKEFKDNRWALRCNPSSGNLHPTEGYAVVQTLPDLEAGVYLYVRRDHGLERRCFLEEGAAADLANALPTDSFLVGLSSIHWRETWKYGERAFRYCQHDVGHAIAALRYAAAALGWSALLLHSFSDDDVAAVLGLNRDADFAGVDPHDREHRPRAWTIFAGTRPGDSRSAAWRPQADVSLGQAGELPGEFAALLPHARRSAAHRADGELSSRHRRGRRLQPGHDRRFHEDDPCERRLAVSPSFLGSRGSRSGVVSGSRRSGHALDRHRLLLR